MDQSTFEAVQKTMNLSDSSIEFNLTQDELAVLYQYEAENWVYRIYLEVFTILALVCILVNMLIAYVIIKYKRLSKEKSNIIILNWTVLNNLFMISSPATLRMAIDLSLWTTISSRTYCFIEQLEYTALFVNIMLMMMLTMYWYLKIHNVGVFEKYMRNFYFFLGAVYVISLFSISLHWDACYNDRNYTLSEVFLLLIYLIFIFFMIVMNLMHFLKKRRVNNPPTRNVPFILTNTFFVTVLPSLLVALAGMFFIINEFVILIMLSTTLLISIINPIYFLLVLYRFDKDYNTFIRHVMSCRCKRYDNEELMEQPVVYNSETRHAENTC